MRIVVEERKGEYFSSNRIITVFNERTKEIKSETHTNVLEHGDK